jgi:magnesium-protoporphyrin O-methyltransferase
MAANETGSVTRATDAARSEGTSAQFEAFYGRRAASDLQLYREKGPRPWTRALVAAVNGEGLAGATLLDIGGGIGAIHHELLDAGVANATCVEASSGYLAAARDESERRGHVGRVTYRHGDFVDLASSIPRADIVTLERVLNVYPEWERLASLAAAHADRILAVVVPRDRRFVRAVIGAMNLVLKLQRQQLRATVIPHDAIDRIARGTGLTLASSVAAGPAWQVLVFRRR